ncbi:hypothetical protein Asulf_01250 [Archaeoglobus sulfaticallidus PM70-1]|uniref:Uncharacterized protein n=1 Tax=Archaeoglobus sulfaticallidus PM70-1 TaxID=387631 RepID=N0BL30_9EURY|nr:hypothetical protein [Archaeoglobus sulfaticallidus]AGK61246.1 hypothetical protein Asulf_01250 [Archaeoglobus sulfaticallidus PM70-1]
MNRYFLPKAGWEFFDVSRAYGLGIIVHALSGDAVVSDMGGFYLIESKRELNFERIDQIHRFLGDDRAWNRTFLTIGSGQREKTKKRVVEFLGNVENIRNILDDLKELKSPVSIGSGKETLYQPMELAATKGIRDEILLKKQYSEGSSVKVSINDFSLSVLGHINATIRKFSNMGMVFAVPSPTRTRILHLIDEIKKRIDDSVKGLHRAGWFPSLAQIAINLVLEELRVEEGGKFAPKFGSLIYGVMTRTGNQWKPLTGGIFPLDFLHQIAESNEAKDVLNKWKDIFEWTAFRKGYEDLPSTLAEFIANPSLSNYERYIKLHLRNELDKDRIKFGSYEKRVLEGVVSFVGV